MKWLIKLFIKRDLEIKYKYMSVEKYQKRLANKMLIISISF